jgi:hypothetical protein
MKIAQPFQRAKARRFGQVGHALPEASRWEVLGLPNAAGRKLSRAGGRTLGKSRLRHAEADGGNQT